MRGRVISQTANVREEASASSRVVGQLMAGQVVEAVRGSPIAQRWLRIAHDGHERFVARRLVAQSPDRQPVQLDPEMQELIGRVVRDASARYDGITYRLGCKAARSGDGLAFSGTDVAGARCSGRTVDCSGWVAGLFQLVAAKVNEQAGRVVFANRATSLLANHSDGQIAGVGERVGQVVSGRDIDGLAMRTGFLFGLNAGDYDWEGHERAFEIDHIVMGVESDRGYMVTQSSSGGGGVNMVPWPDWRRRFANSFEAYRVHCVDLMTLGSWTAGPALAGEDDPAADLFAAPAG